MTASAAGAPRRDRRLVLPEGRTLAFCEWGTPDGRPVLLFHGVPGSRLFCPDAAATAAAGVRLVTYDRPGFGASDPVAAQRALAAHGADVDALLAHLGIARVAIVGWSAGGGPATVYAATRPDRVAHLTLVSATGPLDEVTGAWDRLGDHMRPTAEVARTDPERARRAIARYTSRYLADPSALLGSGRGPDGPVLADPVHGAMLRAAITEALRQGTVGMEHDIVAGWLPWGVRLADVRVPTALFHGALDPSGNADAAAYGREIPGAGLTVWPDAGHLGIVRHWGEVLAASAG